MSAYYTQIIQAEKHIKMEMREREGGKEGEKCNNVNNCITWEFFLLFLQSVCRVKIISK